MTNKKNYVQLLALLLFFTNYCMKCVCGLLYFIRHLNASRDFKSTLFLEFKCYQNVYFLAYDINVTDGSRFCARATLRKETIITYNLLTAKHSRNRCKPPMTCKCVIYVRERKEEIHIYYVKISL